MRKLSNKQVLLLCCHVRHLAFCFSAVLPHMTGCCASRQDDLRDIQRATMGIDAVYAAEGLQVCLALQACRASTAFALSECWHMPVPCGCVDWSNGEWSLQLHYNAFAMTRAVSSKWLKFYGLKLVYQL